MYPKHSAPVSLKVADAVVLASSCAVLYFGRMRPFVDASLNSGV